ncbi:MAG: DNA adenine methylase, partial [Anaerolineales bacterium]|nr:DNA adenine methylase [Anaerolineales bacterium]
TFVYFDPPYRPLSATASFTAYARAAQRFDDAAQQRLAEFYRALDARGAKLMLSNSDPKNINPDDDFFERLYAGFRIARVSAARMINSVASKRGAINELIITNY